MHCILSLLKHVSRQSEGRRVNTVDPASKNSPDHPLGRGRQKKETGIRQEFRPWFQGSQTGIWGLGSSPQNTVKIKGEDCFCGNDRMTVSSRSFALSDG